MDNWSRSRAWLDSFKPGELLHPPRRSVTAAAQRIGDVSRHAAQQSTDLPVWTSESPGRWLPRLGRATLALCLLAVGAAVGYVVLTLILIALT